MNDPIVWVLIAGVAYWLYTNSTKGTNTTSPGPVTPPSVMPGTTPTPVLPMAPAPTPATTTTVYHNPPVVDYTPAPVYAPAQVAPSQAPLPYTPPPIATYPVITTPVSGNTGYPGYGPVQQVYPAAPASYLPAGYIPGVSNPANFANAAQLIGLSGVRRGVWDV